MTMVLASTDVVPGLQEEIERRHKLGLDTFDEWWEGVYVIVTGPGPEHGGITADLGGFVGPLVKRRGLKHSAPLNIGVDKVDCRVPYYGVFRPDTARTSRAFLSSAELVAEILSPSEKAGPKLDFYARHEVKEYLEIDLPRRSVRLLHNDGEEWHPAAESAVLPFRIEADSLIADDGTSYTIDWPPT